MKIEVLGCSGSVMQGYNTTSFLINGNTLLDAGSAASALPESSLSEIKNILITHTHMDHIKELPFIFDLLYSKKPRGITVWGSKITLDALTDHVFNGLIWPDIEELNIDNHFISFKEITEGCAEIDTLRVKAYPAKHIEGSLCYVFSEGDKYIIFSGDTGYDQGLFDLASGFGDDLKAFFIEASFPDRMSGMARLSKHLTPSMIAKGIDNRLPLSAKIIAYHIKPKHIDEVVSELPSYIGHIRGGEVFNL